VEVDGAFCVEVGVEVGASPPVVVGGDEWTRGGRAETRDVYTRGAC